MRHAYFSFTGQKLYLLTAAGESTK